VAHHCVEDEQLLGFGQAAVLAVRPQGEVAEEPAIRVAPEVEPQRVDVDILVLREWCADRREHAGQLRQLVEENVAVVDVLEQRASAHDVIHPTKTPNLWLLPAGSVHVCADVRDADARKAIKAIFEGLSREGFRVLGIASRPVPMDHPHAVVGDEAALVFTGFAAFLDPPKESAAAAMDSALISKWRRRYSRLSLRPKPSVPRVSMRPASHGAIWSATTFM